jgi:hypothetical protein
LEFLTIIIVLVLLELLIQSIIRRVKKDFHWFLEKKDEKPSFDELKFQNYLQKSFDSNLGWVRKSNITGFDSLGKKKIKFQIDKDGSRKTFKKNKKPLVASFGGSYVFGRQVRDHETWQEQTSKEKNFYLLNYGVGNYGADQALIRYQKTPLKKSTKIIILGIVPEHICRIQSEWKHYLEFGNIHGFKPKFYMKNNKLLLKKVPITKKTRIKHIENIINKIKKTDRFYLDKFKKNIFSFPYTLNFIRNFKFNVMIIYIYFSKIKKPLLRKDYFLSEVIKRNIRESHSYYKDEESKELFLALIKKFKLIAKSRKHKPVLIIFPQLMDIEFKDTNIFYKNFFKNEISKEIHTLDLTKNFENKKLKKFFTNKIYGSHLSPLGNKFVSKIIYNFLKKHFNV